MKTNFRACYCLGQFSVENAALSTRCLLQSTFASPNQKFILATARPFLEHLGEDTTRDFKGVRGFIKAVSWPLDVMM